MHFHHDWYSPVGSPSVSLFLLVFMMCSRSFASYKPSYETQVRRRSQILASFRAFVEPSNVFYLDKLLSRRYPLSAFSALDRERFICSSKAVGNAAAYRDYLTRLRRGYMLNNRPPPPQKKRKKKKKRRNVWNYNDRSFVGIRDRDVLLWIHTQLWLCVDTLTRATSIADMSYTYIHTYICTPNIYEIYRG